MRAFLILTLVLSFFTRRVEAQIEWSFGFNESTSEVELTATLEDGWHLYSQFIDNDLGPIPTSFLFKTSDCLKLLGQTKEPTSIKDYDPNFEGELNFFVSRVTFIQRVKVEGNCEIKGVVDYMICNDTKCLPPTLHEFTISVKE